MRATSVYFVRTNDLGKESRHCACKITVDGLGEVELKNCLTIETMDRVFAEAEEALKLKLQGPINIGADSHDVGTT